MKLENISEHYGNNILSTQATLHHGIYFSVKYEM